MSEDFVILVEFDEPGVKQVSTVTEMTAEMVEQSKEAIANALKAITWVGEKAKDALDAVHHAPDEAEIEFGIKVGSKAGVLVSQADAEFHIKATLVWKKPEKEEEKPKGKAEK